MSTANVTFRCLKILKIITISRRSIESHSALISFKDLFNCVGSTFQYGFKRLLYIRNRILSSAALHTQLTIISYRVCTCLCMNEHQGLKQLLIRYRFPHRAYTRGAFLVLFTIRRVVYIDGLRVCPNCGYHWTWTYISQDGGVTHKRENLVYTKQALFTVVILKETTGHWLIYTRSTQVHSQTFWQVTYI